MNQAPQIEEITIPHLFRCPISLELLEDPVTLCTGQTYDRSSIETWLASGNLTCPVTMQKLHDPSIVPNHTLRHLIHQWLQLLSPPQPFINPPPCGNSSPATIDYLVAQKHTLESKDTTLENKLQALKKIRVLSDEYCSSRKTCFLQLSFLPLLLELVFGKEEGNQMEFTELALSCILKLLPLVNLEPLNVMIKDEAKLATFLLLFEKGTSLVKISLCHLIESTSASEETKGVCQVLGNSHKLVHEIVLLLIGSQNCVDSSKAAIKAMSALCSLQSNRESLVRAGAIDGIITFIYGSKKKNLEAPPAMEILEKLIFGVESAKEALVIHQNGIEILVKMVFRVSNQECCSESAVGMLLVLCRDFWRASEEAIEAGILTQLLFLLQSQCSNRTKTKARMLLKLLRSKWIEEPMQV